MFRPTRDIEEKEGSRVIFLILIYVFVYCDRWQAGGCKAGPPITRQIRIIRDPYYPVSRKIVKL